MESRLTISKCWIW